MDDWDVVILLPSIRWKTEVFERCIRSIKRNALMPHKLVVYKDRVGVGFGNAVQEALKQITGNPIVHVVAEDCTFGNAWLSRLFDGFQRTFRDREGLAEPNEDMCGVLASYPMATKENLQKYMHRGYKHNFVDQELKEIFDNKGKYLWVPESVILHHRYEVDDKHYQWADKYYEKDKELYESRQKYINSFKKENEQNA